MQLPVLNPGPVAAGRRSRWRGRGFFVPIFQVILMGTPGDVFFSNFPDLAPFFEAGAIWEQQKKLVLQISLNAVSSISSDTSDGSRHSSFFRIYRLMLKPPLEDLRWFRWSGIISVRPKSRWFKTKHERLILYMEGSTNGGSPKVDGL